MEQNGSTTAEQANQKVNTTEALFADLLPVDEPQALPTEDKGTETADSQASKKEEVAATSAPKEPEYLDVNGFGDRKVKVKVDGIETEIPFKDVVKGYQTERYLTQKGQMIAEERKKLQETATPPTTHSDDDYIDPLMAEEMRNLKKELEFVKETSKAAISELMPIRYERNLSVIDSEMKTEGLTDFKEHVPEIEKIIRAMPPDKAETYDTVDGFKFLYKNLKLQELVKKQASTTDKNTNADVRPTPRVVQIESGSSPSGGATSRAAEREKALTLAKKSGDWTDFMDKFG